MTTQPISKDRLDTLQRLGLPEVKEKNQWLVLHVKGDGMRAPLSWNARVYKDSAENMKVVTTDMATLVALLECNEYCVDCKPQKFAECEETSLAIGVNKVPPRIISIDDSGWGFPLLGTLVGIHDSKSGRIAFCEVPVEYYQSPRFEAKMYLMVAAIETRKLLAEIFNILEGSAPNVLFKVCPGYVNTYIVELLRTEGFKVETCAIGEPLQSALEKAHAEYVQKHVGSTLLYYDPKELTDSNIRKAYSETIKWIQKYNAWHLAKTGWKSLKKLQPGV